ncbi:DNA gyrase inhibitor YacG [Thiobacillus sp.]|uniref:DNA gyrase inhibitor YacG n=1 Tax=Thiobacillus sp. TaxID=924 RepID=UPI0025D86E13|nr:DNA gyrase inhibitor YacG [Thiobacillus sp.]
MKPSPKPPVVSCPICGAAVSWTAASRWKPFCSERCKLIDLGQWATEKYRVPAEEEQEPEDGAPPTQ